MSKRKHFHSIGSGKKMFQYAAMDNVGLPRRFPPKKKTPAGAANTDEGKAEKGLRSSNSASTITESGGFVK